jgi:hypothetical protein
MVSRILTFLAVALGCSISYAEEAVEIPLSEVWTANMASRHMLMTKKLTTLDPEYSSHQGSYLNSRMFQITQTLSRGDPNDTTMRPGFAILSEKREVLEQVHAALVEGQTPQVEFLQGNNISVVFFTRQIGYMHLMRIERLKGTITIEYCLEPVGSLPHLSPKVAIIPLGKLPPGEYHVKMLGFSKKPDDRKSACEPISDDLMKKLICQPFEFTIVEEADETTHSDK